jgi:peptidoglycan/LPS O-acetylase OafA/YrhL
MRILQIQGLRAVAALLVTIFHARLMPGGFIGVDIFYVISGYLITGLIIREIDKTGRLDLNEFYQRRIKRLIPTSVFVLFVTAIVGFFVLPAITREALGRDLFAAAAYISNYLFAWWENDYQNLDATPSPFIHYWSLAVEEQFYIVWPIFILFLSRYGKRAILNGVAIVTGLSLLLSIYLTQVAPIWAFYSLPTRAWELGVGALLLFIPDKFLRNRFFPWIGALGLIVATLRFDESTAFPGINAALPVFATAVLIGTIPVWPRFFNDLSNNRLMQWLGAISYPLYLWHWPALVLPSSALGRPLTIFERFLCILLTVFLAHYTSKFIEQPLRHRNFSAKKVYGFFSLTTVASLLAGIAIATSASSVIKVQETASDYSFDLKQVLRQPAIFIDDCHANYGEVESGVCRYGVIGAAKKVVLFGDSHAAQWFPALEALAREKGFELISLTKSACPAVAVKRTDKGSYINSECNQWRKNMFERIKEIKPDAVLTSSFQYYANPRGTPSREQWWNDGQLRLLAELQGSSKNLIYISDTPHPLRNIPDCLATQDVKACDTTEKTPNLIIDGFTQIDPTPWLCTNVCPAIKDGYVVYRDASHITVDAALGMKENLGVALQDKGLFP